MPLNQPVVLLHVLQMRRDAMQYLQAQLARQLIKLVLYNQSIEMLIYRLCRHLGIRQTLTTDSRHFMEEKMFGRAVKIICFFFYYKSFVGFRMLGLLGWMTSRNM